MKHRIFEPSCISPMGLQCTFLAQFVRYSVGYM